MMCEEGGGGGGEVFGKAPGKKYNYQNKGGKLKGGREKGENALKSHIFAAQSFYIICWREKSLKVGWVGWGEG